MIKILGAGLSGLSAAVKLAQAGVDVEVFEKRSFIGGVTDDSQAMRNYEHDYDQLEYFRENGIRLDNAKPIHNIIKYAPSGRSMTVHSEYNKPLFYVFRRGPGKISIEHQLYKKATQLGVNVEFNSSLDIGNADIVSVGGLYNNIWAYGAIYTDANVVQDTILFFMDNTYCPKGYIYLVPHGNEVTIAATTFEIGCPIPQLFKRFIQENPVMKDALDGATFVKNVSGFEYSNVPKTAIVNGKKIVGSAAGFLDPSRGFGIKYALLSGMLAAKSIVENKDYDQLWKESFEEELIQGLKRRLLLEKMSNEDYEKFIMEDKVSIKRYNKLPDFMRKRLLEASFSLELAKYRRKYNLGTAFKRTLKETPENVVS